MAFEVRIARKQAGDRAGDVYELIDTDETVRAEVWPQWGFNCLRWQLRQDDGRWADILYCAPNWESNPVPTRSGHPILFPFPGRIRGGKFSHAGTEYELPVNDPAKQNASHGFTPRNPWRVDDWNGDEEFAFVTGEFTLSKQFPEGKWPADFTLKVTYRLHHDRLRVAATVENRGSGTLPFGLGYHPYFRLPGVNDPDIGGHILQANASELWVAEGGVPTGWRNDVPGNLDFRHPLPIGGTELDHIYTSVSGPKTDLSDFREMAVLSHPEALGRVRFLAEPAFRELVLFTPPHRQAIAIEPYTCTADAANLDPRGIDSGWVTLAPGEEWEAAVEYQWVTAEV